MRVMPPAIEVADVQAALAFERVAERHQVGHLSAAEAAMRLRLELMVQVGGVRPYVRLLLGHLADLPVSRWELYATPSALAPVPVQAQGESLVEYVAKHFSARTLPRRVRLLRGRAHDQTDYDL